MTMEMRAPAPEDQSHDDADRRDQRDNEGIHDDGHQGIRIHGRCRDGEIDRNLAS